MTPETKKKIVEYIKLSAPLVEAHLNGEHEKLAAAQRVQDSIPQVVDALVANQRINENEREKAAAALSDHSRTLEILANVAKHRTAEELSHLGAPDTTKKASAERSPYCGVPRAGESARDDAWFRKLGIRS